MQVCILPHLSRACLNTVLKPATHQTSGKLLESVRRSKKDGRKTEHVTDHYLCSAYQDSKLMESCVASDITNHVVTQNLRDDRQWPYRKGNSTQQLLKHLTERWRESIERKLFVGILFVDLTKAFDTVSHNILPQKLNDLAIRGDIWLWLKNYLTERRQSARINGCDSDTHIITHGVPQESVLRPTFSLSLQRTSQNHYAVRKLTYMQTTQQYTISQKRWIC